MTSVIIIVVVVIVLLLFNKITKQLGAIQQAIENLNRKVDRSVKAEVTTQKEPVIAKPKPEPSVQARPVEKPKWQIIVESNEEFMRSLTEEQINILNNDFDSEMQKRHEFRNSLSQKQREMLGEVPKPVVQSSKIPSPVKPMYVIGEDTVEKEEEKERATTSPTFMERNPDLEKFVGENLINKIGIGILVLGIGFFVKYAIDKNWINEVARVGIGLLCGGILIGIAHKLRNTFTAFSSVLVGGGIAVLYFTIAIAFHEYQLFGQTLAFIIMVVITAFAVLLSLTYNKIELAVISLLGGFATPFILSTGSNDYILLFSYISVLNVGMLVLAYYKKWNLINIIAYVLTVAIFGFWLINTGLNMEFPPYVHILIFATLFYVIFFLMNIINNVMAKREFKSVELSILISNTFLYYAVGMVVLKELGDGNYQGLFTALLGLINFVFAFFLHQKERVDQNLVYLLIGLVMTFATLAGPVQLEGNYITLFWAAEAVLLLWLCFKSGIKIMGYAALIVTALMIVSLTMDWTLYATGTADFAILINKLFLTGLFSIASLLATNTLLSYNKELNLFPALDVTNYGKIILAASLVITYLVGLLEFNYQLDQRLAFYPMRSVILASYNFSFIIFIYVFSRIKENKELLNFSILLVGLGLLSYITFYTTNIISLRDEFLLNSPAYFGGFLYHYLDLLLVFGLIYIGIEIFKRKDSILENFEAWVPPVLSIYLLIVLSLELDHLVSWLSYYPGRSIGAILEQNHKIGFPILWGVFSFVLMWMGMKYKSKHMRIVSLSILLITLLKLFLYDIKDVSETGKIAAFICLGILLLIISFMYQRLKKLIIEDKDVKVEKDAAST